MKTIKAFVSYSWSSPEHEKWVLDLATDLRESGIDVVLDKWDLKEGHDANAFMEKMVSDTDIKKVIIVCDRTYAEKSNARLGGAGTEAQIISKELYQQQNQDKFVAVIAEKDDADKPYLPTYYTSRIHIDFSDPSRYSEKFEQLLRWIADKPIHKKPELGKPPAYLSDGGGVTLATSALKRRAYDAIVGFKEYALPAAKEYFELFTAELEKFRLEPDIDPLTDGYLSNLDSFVPYRNECLEVVKAIARYTRDEQYADLLYAFFDRFLQYYDPPETMNSYREIAFDNYKFFGHELLLHCAAILVAEERHDLFNALVDQQYYREGQAKYGAKPLCEFTIFRQYLRSLEARNREFNLRRLSLAADLLKERAANSGTHFRKLMEVDFVLFLRAELANFDAFNMWWPETLVYLGVGYRTFEMFERSRSTRYFKKIQPFLANASKTDLEDLISRYQRNERELPRWEITQVNPGILLGIKNLCTRP